MNGLQIVGVILAVLGSLVALTGAVTPDISMSGGTGAGGPSGMMEMSFRSFILPGLVVGGIGVALVFAGRPAAPPPSQPPVQPPARP